MHLPVKRLSMNDLASIASDISQMNEAILTDVVARWGARLGHGFTFVQPLRYSDHAIFPEI